MVTHHWPPRSHHSIYSGYERIAHYMKNLCDVKVLTWGSKPDKQVTDVPTEWVPTPPTDIFLERRLLLSLIASLRTDDFDIVHSLYSVPSVFPSLRTKTVATAHIVSQISPDNVWLRYKSMWQKVLFPRCSGILAMSKDLAKTIEMEYGGRNVVYIPHGIDTTHFDPKKANRDYFERFGEKFDLVCLTIGAHGANLPQTKRLAVSNPNVLFALVGAGQSVENIEGNILMLPRLSEEEMIDAYASCDFFFRPLKFATANNSLLEAMSMGKVTITDRIPGVVDYLDDETSFLVEDCEYQNAFELAIENPEERERRARNAHSKARNEFDWRIVTQRTMSFYQETLRG